MGTMTIREAKKIDLDTIMEKDPAATSRLSVRWTYSGYKALCAYRYAHWLYLHGLKTLAHYLAYRSKVKTGVEIHPAAVIGQRLFIDHGTGLVVGETTEIGNDCVLYRHLGWHGQGYWQAPPDTRRRCYGFRWRKDTWARHSWQG
ncbi:MAG: hypothetical protein RSC44_01155 [Clostridia bacterium]